MNVGAVAIRVYTYIPFFQRKKMNDCFLYVNREKKSSLLIMRLNMGSIP